MAIIGWLLRISIISRTALKDKHLADLSAKDSKISELETVISITKSQNELVEKERDRLQNEINSGNVNANELLATLEILKRKSEAEVESAQIELNKVMSELQLKEKEIEKFKLANQKFVADLSGRQDIQLSMISTVAHETKSLTASIQHRIHYLLNQSEKNNLFDKRSNEYFRDIINELRMLTQMYDTFLQRGKSIEPHLSISKLQNIFDDVLNMLNKHIRQKNIEIKISGISSIPSVKVDSTIFTQAVFSLVLNSIQYSYRDSKIIILGENTNEGIVIRIQDFGIGFKENEKDKIFEPFYVGAESRSVKVSGTGLGLYVAKKIINSHGGEINISNLRMPTEIKILLPSRIIAK